MTFFYNRFSVCNPKKKEKISNRAAHGSRPASWAKLLPLLSLSSRAMRDGRFVNDLWRLRFEGVNRLYGTGSIERLAASHVVVVGLGGVGSWTVEALARSGVGSLSLVDLDEVCISNTNRQLHALSHTVGSSKASALAERVALINPDCAVRLREEWLTVDGAGALVDEEVTAAWARLQAAARVQSDPVPDLRIDGGALEQWLAQLAPLMSMPPAALPVSLLLPMLPNLAVVDAMDGYADKAALLAACALRRVRCVSVGAAGGLTDPTMIRAGDLTIAGDGLLKQTRGEMRRRHGFPPGLPHRNPEWGIRAVYSVETGRASIQGRQKASSAAFGLPKGDCDRFGTACFATGAVGFAAAAEVVTPLATAAALPSAVEGVSGVAGLGTYGGVSPEIAGGVGPDEAAGSERANGAHPEITGGVDVGRAGVRSSGAGANEGEEMLLPPLPVASESAGEAPSRDTAATGVPRSGVPRMCGAWGGRGPLDSGLKGDVKDTEARTRLGASRAAYCAWGSTLEPRILIGHHSVHTDASPSYTTRAPATSRHLVAGTRLPLSSSQRLPSHQLGSRRLASVRLMDQSIPGAASAAIGAPRPRLFDSHSHCHEVNTHTRLWRCRPSTGATPQPPPMLNYCMAHSLSEPLHTGSRPCTNS
jgi:tRNA A37 threonylcarbamoyladenosine dehydratase